MFSKNVKASFKYCNGVSFNDIKSGNFKNNMRLCEVSASLYSLYLVSSESGLILMPYEYKEHQCKKVLTDFRLKEFSIYYCLKTEDYLVSELKKMFFYQFPSAEISFYNNLPSKEEVLYLLNRRPTISEVEFRGYTFYTESRITLQEAEGIIYIDVHNGRLRIPYKQRDKEFLLLLDDYIYEPDNILYHFWINFWDKIDEIISTYRFDELVLRFRNYINNKF